MGGSSVEAVMGGSAFAMFFGSLFCGGAIAGSELLGSKKKIKKDDAVEVDAEVVD
jgi:hypothetical protein